MPRTALLLGLAALSAACAEELPTIVQLQPASLTVAGDVTIDSINPAVGVVSLLEPGGASLATTTLVDGRYRFSHLFDPGIDVCQGHAVRTRIVDNGSTREQTKNLEPRFGACVVLNDDGITQRIDIDFPFLLGGPSRSGF